MPTAGMGRLLLLCAACCAALAPAQANGGGSGAAWADAFAAPPHAGVGPGLASAPKAKWAERANAAWSTNLEAEFEMLRTTLPTLDYPEAKVLLQEAKARVGPRPPTLMYPQDKIEHMVVLFVENRASDHIWGCMLGDRPGFDGIPSDSAAAKDNITGCGTATLVCKGKKTPLLSHFCTKKDYFTKTGSGQT